MSLVNCALLVGATIAMSKRRAAPKDPTDSWTKRNLILHEPGASPAVNVVWKTPTWPGATEAGEVSAIRLTGASEQVSVLTANE